MINLLKRSPFSLVLCSLSTIRLIAMDVDGVLTDGSKQYDTHGQMSMNFDARDGLGIWLLIKAGMQVAFITNSSSDIVKARANDLGVSTVYSGVEEKGEKLRDLQGRFRIGRKETLYIGDDLWDVSAFQEASVRVAMPESPRYIKKAANWITQKPGGHGAVREVADAVLNAQGVNLIAHLQKRI